MRAPIGTALGAAVHLMLAASALAHEPLWGESPQTFAFGVVHPGFRLGYSNDNRMLSGSRGVTNPTDLRRSRIEGLVSLQYAPATTLNLRIEVPFAQVRTAQTVAGTRRTSSTSGLGDITLLAKSRVHQRFGEDWKVHQAVIGGVQLPTAAKGGAYPDGSPIGVSDRTGSGHFGYLVGYAFAYERLRDTAWMSLAYRRDFGGTEQHGDMLEADANYGYWLRRAVRPQDLGVMLSAGAHAESMGRDRMASMPDPDSGYTMVGLQSTLIVTQGPSQFRIGVLAPIYQRVNGTQLRPEIVVRAGGEWLF